MTILLLKNKQFDKYKTIWESDKGLLFERLWNESLFKQYGFMETRWDIIDDKAEVKRVLDDKFSSKGRGEDYTEGLPSGTVLSSSLFPVNLVSELYKLQWLNNISVEAHNAQEKENLISLEMGTYVHKILELWLTSDLPMAKRKIADLIDQAKEDTEIIYKIPDLASKQVKYENLAYNILPKYIEDVLCKYDIIGSEIFLNTGKLQGSVDLLAKRDGKFYLIDFKTTRKVYKQTGKRKFSGDADISDYKNQLCVYSNMLIDCGYIPKVEKKNIEYRLYQFHLLAEEFKEFKIPNEEILSREENIQKVVDWYWDMKRIIPTAKGWIQP